MTSLKALEKLRAKYGLEEKDCKLYISIINSLKALDILLKHLEIKNNGIYNFWFISGLTERYDRGEFNELKELIYENVKNKN